MIDFIFAGVLYLAIMFVVFFSISFLTIGFTYAMTRVVRQCAQRVRPAHFAFK